jgi:hypothetical protein
MSYENNRLRPVIFCGAVELAAGTLQKVTTNREGREGREVKDLLFAHET